MPTRLAALCLSIMVLVAAACGGDSGASERQTTTADVYVAVLRALIPPFAEGEDKQVVYVTPFDDQKAFPLETQAAVIADLDNVATVRFVDELDAAVHAGESGAPSKGNEVILLGPVTTSTTGPTMEVEAQKYVSETEQIGYRFQVTATADGTLRATELERNAVPPTTSR